MEVNMGNGQETRKSSVKLKKKSPTREGSGEDNKTKWKGAIGAKGYIREIKSPSSIRKHSFRC